MTRLTVRRLEAIEEALSSRLAGETDIDIEREDYEAAYDWVIDELSRRKALTKRTITMNPRA